MKHNKVLTLLLSAGLMVSNTITPLAAEPMGASVQIETSTETESLASNPDQSTVSTPKKADVPKIDVQKTEPKAETRASSTAASIAEAVTSQAEQPKEATDSIASKAEDKSDSIASHVDNEKDTATDSMTSDATSSDATSSDATSSDATSSDATSDASSTASSDATDPKADPNKDDTGTGSGKADSDDSSDDGNQTSHKKGSDASGSSDQKNVDDADQKDGEAPDDNKSDSDQKVDDANDQKKQEEEDKKKADDAKAQVTLSEISNSIHSGNGTSSSYGISSFTGGISSINDSFYMRQIRSRSNLRANFEKVDKVYAIANQTVMVREEARPDAAIVGRMGNGALAYIIDDTEGDWYFIESGDVRGFVLKTDLASGEEVDRQVQETEEKNFQTATIAKDISKNKAYRYVLKTARDEADFTKVSAKRQAMIEYSRQFLGKPYVWGGEDPNTGADCSGFVGYVYRNFGISLPRCSYEQAETGVRIDAKDAVPGDLIFYARNGVVYHVLMYIGDGKAINAQSTATGIVISNVNYDKACWATRYLPVEAGTTTTAAELMETGRQAYEGDQAAQEVIIERLAEAAEDEWEQYGFAKSVLIAQVINESGWVSFAGASNGGIQPEDNNILGMNAELLNDQWQSPWNGKQVSRNVPQNVNGVDVYGHEMMRAYDSLEACLADYAAFKIGIHPSLQGSTDIDRVITEGLKGYATDPNYNAKIKQTIEKYNLTRFDAEKKSTDGNSYTQEEKELIWAIVAQEDDGSYDGALAVISSVMNRADQNYGGYGTSALDQLTADGQYCYSPKVSNPIYYQRRLGGNVAEFVKQAVDDCLTNGTRNHNFINFRSGAGNGGRTKIGANWYF